MIASDVMPLLAQQKILEDHLSSLKQQKPILLRLHQAVVGPDKGGDHKVYKQAVSAFLGSLDAIHLKAQSNLTEAQAQPLLHARNRVLYRQTEIINGLKENNMQKVSDHSSVFKVRVNEAIARAAEVIALYKAEDAKLAQNVKQQSKCCCIIL